MVWKVLGGLALIFGIIMEIITIIVIDYSYSKRIRKPDNNFMANDL